MFSPSLRHEGPQSIAGFGGIAMDCGAARHNDGWVWVGLRATMTGG
ncbi:MAG: hypothetical protein P4L66_04430 [Acetobacteraceae bacterium]|nr:hypothetical protein [Acetobacteraceae bacterium]